MEIPKIRTLTLQFDTEIAQHEVPLLRGAVLSAMKGSAHLLFHNHLEGEGVRYAYPLIQYKRIRQCAAIVCLNEGADALGQFLTAGGRDLKLGEREVCLSTHTMRASHAILQVWQGEFNYHLRRWLPLNRENYRRYITATDLVERMELLQNILRGNILSMAKGVGIHVEKEIEVRLTSISAPYLIQNKGTRLMAFNADFKSNVSLPNHIGLGKNASIGYGIVQQKRTWKPN